MALGGIGLLPTIGLLGPSIIEGGSPAILGFGLLSGLTGSLIGTTESEAPYFQTDIEHPAGFGQELDNVVRHAQSMGLGQYLGPTGPDWYGLGAPQDAGTQFASVPTSFGSFGGQVGWSNGASFGGFQQGFQQGGFQQSFGAAFGAYQSSYHMHFPRPPQHHFGCYCQPSYGYPWGQAQHPPAGQYFFPAPVSQSAQLWQQQYSYGYGGPPPGPVHPAPPQPPSSQPPAHAIYQKVPQIAEGQWGQASAIVASRVVGTPANRNLISFGGQDPGSNADGMRNMRLGVWQLMQLDDTMRYDADSGKFFRTYSDGTRRDLLDISQVSTAIAQSNGNPAAANNLLSGLLSGVTNPTTPPPVAVTPSINGPTFGTAAPRPAFAQGATLVNQSSTPEFELPPITNPQVFQQDPAGAQALLDQLIQNNPTLDTEQFLQQALGIRQLLPGGASTGIGNPGQPGQTGPFIVHAHRYFNHDRQEWVDVDRVSIHEKGNWRERTQAYNPAQQIDFEATKPDAQTGKTYQVAVYWEDGATKVWDYRMDGPNSRVDVFSPFA